VGISQDPLEKNATSTREKFFFSERTATSQGPGPPPGLSRSMVLCDSPSIKLMSGDFAGSIGEERYFNEGEHFFFSERTATSRGPGPPPPGLSRSMVLCDSPMQGVFRCQDRYLDGW